MFKTLELINKRLFGEDIKNVILDLYSYSISDGDAYIRDIMDNNLHM